MENNRRITDWEINSGLDEEEIQKVKFSADQIIGTIKNNELSYFQAIQALELAKVIIGEASLY